MLISATALNNFYSGCPLKAKYFAAWNMQPEYMPSYYKFGIAVHAAMEGKKTTDDAMIIADRLRNLADKNGFTILKTEVWHRARLTDDITLVGKIDALALDSNGMPALLDWKTASYPWKKFKTEEGEVIVTKALGWQGTIYTMPPTKLPLDWEEWPESINFMVAPSKGKANIYPYYQTEEDVQNLIWACEEYKRAKDSDAFVMNPGYNCEDCMWKHVHWKTPGWEKYYTPRRKR